MANTPTFDEWLLSLFDYDRNGKINGLSEKNGMNRATKKKNIATYQQMYAQYVAQLEKGNQINAGIEQNNAILAAAIQGNEAAAGVLTGDTKSNIIAQYGKYIIAGVLGMAALVLILRN